MDVGIVMNPAIAEISPAKDSSFALLLAASRRGWNLHYMEPSDLFLQDGIAMARARPLQVQDNIADWYSLGTPSEMPLRGLDLVFMRADPPVDMQYMFMTWILEVAEADGVPIYNPPGALRNLNEKLAAGRFRDITPPTLVSMDIARIRDFVAAQGIAVVKPLNSMGGDSVFRVALDDPNCDEILRLVSHNQQRYITAQKFIPEVSLGDKRILLINGEPVKQALLRIPATDSIRANMAAGGHYRGAELEAADIHICKQLKLLLQQQRLLLTGIDVIGGLLTEINITSPTGIRQLDSLYNVSIADQVLDAIPVSNKQ